MKKAKCRIEIKENSHIHYRLVVERNGNAELKGMTYHSKGAFKNHLFRFLKALNFNQQIYDTKEIEKFLEVGFYEK